MRRVAWLLLAGLSLIGCGGSPASPSADAPVRVTIMPLPTFAGNPNTAAFTATVANVTSGTVDLTFPSSCQLLPYFVDRRTGQAVTPAGGGTACAAVITHLSLVPSLSMSQVFMVKAGTAPEPTAIVLPPGEYGIYARLEDQQYRVQSPQIVFTLK